MYIELADLPQEAMKGDAERMPGTKRIVLLHWNEEEARPRVKRLRTLGFRVEWIAPRGGAGLKPFVQHPPDAFLIDLTRLPSHGRAIAVFFRQRKATRGVPIVFMGGEAEKVEKARELLPDATYLSWEDAARLQRDITKAEARDAIRPNTMAEYARVPLARKLGVQDGVATVLLGVPEEVRERLGDYEEATTGDRVLFFARSMRDLTNGFEAAAARVKRGGGLWVMWAKKASSPGSDLTMPAIRALALESGWVDYRVCSVDDTWSGMLFARKARPAKKSK